MAIMVVVEGIVRSISVRRLDGMIMHFHEKETLVCEGEPVSKRTALLDCDSAAVRVKKMFGCPCSLNLHVATRTHHGALLARKVDCTKEILYFLSGASSRSPENI
jgi:hypothetical protein